MTTTNTENTTTVTTSPVAQLLLDKVNAKAKSKKEQVTAMVKASKEAATVAKAVELPALPATVPTAEVNVEATAPTNELATLHRWLKKNVKKFGRDAVEKATREAAREVIGRKAPTRFSDDAVITLLKTENPHAKGSKLAKYWNKYRNGMTVAEALKAGIIRVNIRYLNSIGYIKVG